MCYRTVKQILDLATLTDQRGKVKGLHKRHQQVLVAFMTNVLANLGLVEQRVRPQEGGQLVREKEKHTN